MPTLKELQEQVNALDQPGNNIDHIAQVAKLMAELAEARKNVTEATIQGRKWYADRAQFVLSILTTVVTTIVLVRTFDYQAQQFRENSAQLQRSNEMQVLQFKENSEQQRKANEVKEWTDTVRFLEDGKVPSEVIGTALLRTFLNGSQHEREARGLVVELLGNVTNADCFDQLWTDIIEKTDAAHFPELVRVTAGLSKNYFDMGAHIEELTKGLEGIEATRQARLSRKGAPAPPVADLDLRVSQCRGEIEHYESMRRDVEKQVYRAGTDIGGFLKDPVFRMGFKTPPVLKGAALWSIDLSGADLDGLDIRNADLQGANLRGATLERSRLQEAFLNGGANLEGTQWRGADVRGASLAAVEYFQGSQWDAVAWWRASEISPALLAYLEQTYPFVEGTKYAGGDATKEEYDEAVASLRKPE